MYRQKSNFEKVLYSIYYPFGYLMRQYKFIIKYNNGKYEWDTYPKIYTDLCKIIIEEAHSKGYDPKTPYGNSCWLEDHFKEWLPEIEPKTIRRLIKKGYLIEFKPGLFCAAPRKERPARIHRYGRYKPTITLKQDAHKRVIRRKNAERRNRGNRYQGDLPYYVFDNVENPRVSTGHPLRGKNYFTLLDKKKQRKYNRAISKRGDALPK